VQDLLLWCTMEFGYARLADGFVQCSSIMPQKRNPVALEHARAIGSKALGQCSAVLLAVHNTPFGDIVDTEDDLQPLVFTMFRDAVRAVRLVTAALSGTEFNIARMAQRASEGWITVTELADTLVREHGVPFKAAHAIASRLVASQAADPAAPLSSALRTVSEAILGWPVELDETSLVRVLSPRHFVEVRTTPGGPAPQETARAIAASEKTLESDDEWFAAATQRLHKAQDGLRDAVASL
jgi:argininosuccinate lyase